MIRSAAGCRGIRTVPAMGRILTAQLRPGNPGAFAAFYSCRRCEKMIRRLCRGARCYERAYLVAVRFCRSGRAAACRKQPLLNQIFPTPSVCVARRGVFLSCHISAASVAVKFRIPAVEISAVAVVLRYAQRFAETISVE